MGPATGGQRATRTAHAHPHAPRRGPHNTPAITDPAEAREDLVMAALSAIAHAADPDINAV
ncbi:hypothetical protein GCM10023084_73350 [Streptomyces lacrimifluminis]